MRRPKHVQLQCGHCQKMFAATQNQAWRASWPSTRTRKVGFACSPTCRSAIAVGARKNVNPLPPKKLAYSRLNNAIDSGKVVRPETCEKCGRRPKRDRLGRSRIEGHHHDYAKPLDVEWLCDSCHKAVTPRARGERNHAAKFTVAKVVAIRKARARGAIPADLARKYSVTPKAIHDILQGKTWRHVPCC